jgi:hypothetical protein
MTAGKPSCGRPVCSVTDKPWVDPAWLSLTTLDAMEKLDSAYRNAYQGDEWFCPDGCFEPLDDDLRCPGCGVRFTAARLAAEG